MNNCAQTVRGKMGAGASADSVVVCKEGDRVKVNYKSQGKFYPGTIAACNDNGTYLVDYDDGEKEKEVRVHQIRSLEKPPSPKKLGSPKSPNKADCGLNIPPCVVPKLHRFWALMVQGLQCKAWRLGEEAPTTETLKRVEETNEVFWMLALDSPVLCVGTMKSQNPGSDCLRFELVKLQKPRRVIEQGTTHPMFLIHDGEKQAVIGVDTDKSANLLVQLVGDMITCLNGTYKAVQQEIPIAAKPAPPTAMNSSNQAAEGAVDM